MKSEAKFIGVDGGKWSECCSDDLCSAIAPSGSDGR